MHLIQQSTGEKIEAIIESLMPVEFKIIKKSKRFPGFSWDLEKKNEVVKIRRFDSDEVLGLMSLIDFKQELWIKINLLQISKENVGNRKEYDRIAGCLISYACKQAFIRGYGGFVALEPKTELQALYINKYGMAIAGKHFYSSTENSESLIQEYYK